MLPRPLGRKHSTRKPPKSRRSAARSDGWPRKFRPRIELLEDRTLLTNNLAVTFNANQFFSQGFEAIKFTVQGHQEDFGVGFLPIVLSKANGTNPLPEFQTLCVDALDSLNGPPTYSYPVLPTPAATGLPANGGQIAYLYNHYGFQPYPFTYNASFPLAKAVGLQLAIWELEYGLTDASFHPDTNFTTQAQLNQALVYTDAFVADAAGKNENAIFLDATLGGTITPNGGQGVLAPYSQLSGTVFVDANHDCIQQPGELGLPGVTVTLTGTTLGGDSVSLTTTTDANGRYSFTNLMPGTYTATETQPAGYVHEGQTLGTNGGAGSTTGNHTITEVLGLGVSSTANNFCEENPDVDVTKTPDAPSVNAGGTAGFTVKVTNEGVSTAVGVTLSDPLPAGLGNDVNWKIDTTTGNPGSFQITGAVGSQVLSLNPSGITLAPGASLTVHITGVTSAKDTSATTFLGTLTNTATVNATNEITAEQNDQSSASITVLAPDVDVLKTADAPSVNAGGTAGFTVKVFNEGQGTANGVTLSDPLPAGLGGDVNWQIDTTTGNFAAFTITGPVGSQVLSLSPSGVSLAAGASLTVHITGVTSANDTDAMTFVGTLTNTATVNATNELASEQNDQSSASITVLAPDVDVLKLADQPVLNAGDTAGFTVKVFNEGQGAAVGVTLSDPLPAGLGNDLVWSIDTTTGNPGSFQITGTTPGAQTLTLAPGVTTLAAGASLSVHIVSTPLTAADAPNNFTGTLANTATVNATNETTAEQNDQSSAGVTVNAPDVDVLKTPDAPTVNAGDTAGFTVTIFNEGQGTATGVTLNDPLPAGLGSDVNWQIDTTTGNPGSFQITGAVGSQVLSLSPSGISLAAGASLTVHITGVTSANDTSASTFLGTLTNTATVNAANEAAAEQNDQSSASITVLAPDVDVLKTPDAPTVNAGGTAGFTVTITNEGQGTAVGVTLSDPLPGGLGSDINWQIDTTTGNPGSFQITGAVGSQVLSLKGVSTLAAGASLTVHITGVTSASDTDAMTFLGTLPNTATVNATNELTSEQNDQSSASITVLAPDVDVTKTADKATINAGDTAGFTVTVFNEGQGTANGVTLSDPLPGGLGSDVNWQIDTTTGNPGSFQITGAVGSQTLSLKGVSTLAAGASLTVHITGVTSANDTDAMTFLGTLPNTATVNATNELAAEQNDQSSDTVTVLAPDVDVTKTADQPVINAGDTAGFTVTITNEGQGTANGVTLSDPLPAGLGSDVNWQIDTTTGNFAAFTITGPVGSQVLSLSPSGISLAAGASLTVHITGVTSANDTSASTFKGTLPNTASVNASNELAAEQNDQSSATITVLAPDVDVTKTADNGTINAGDTAGFTVTVTNEGLGTATGVTLSDPLPGGLGSDINWQIDTGTGNPGSFQITGAVGSQVLSLSGVNSLAAGASLTVHITGATSANDTSASTFKGTLPNTATVNATNELAAEQNDNSSATITVLAPDVDVTKTADKATVNAGDTAGFTVTVTNEGQGTASGVTLSDPLPGGLGSDVNWQIDTGTGNPGSFQITGAVGSQTLSLKGVSTLAAGASLTVHITGVTSANDTSASTFKGTLPNTATVNATNELAAEQNDNSSATITVLAPDVDVTKTADKATINAGDTAGFTVTITNEGLGTANGVTLSDPLPGGLGSDVNWQIDTGTGNPGSFQITGAVGSQVLSLKGVSTLAAGASLTVHITGVTSANDTSASTFKGTLPNTATVNATNELAAEQNDNSSATITIVAPDVDVTKTADKGTINAGDTAGFTVTVTNEGLGTASGVTLSDPLPGGLGSDINWKIDATTGNPGSFQITGAVGSQTLSLNGVSTLAAGASLTVHITGVTSANDTSASTFKGTLPNTATVNATNELAAEQNDNSSATITVLAPDVDVMKTADKATINAGDTAGFTVTVTNEGQGTANGVTLSDPLPGGLGSDVNWKIDTTTGNPTAFAITGPVGSQVLSLSPSGISLAAGASLTVHITGVTSANDTSASTFKGTLPNTATVNASNELAAEQNDNSSATITVLAPDVDVAKTADKATINAGDTAGFTVTITNEGLGTATGVSLSDPLPGGLGSDVNWQIDTATGSPGSFQITGAVGSQVLSLKGVSTLAAGASLTVHITGVTSANDTSASTFKGTLPNTATVNATNELAAEQNDQSSATITILAPDVDVTKTADKATINGGDTAGFTVTITNEGQGTATGVTLSDPLPAGAGTDVNWKIDTTTGNPGSFQITGAVGSQTLSLNGVSTLAAGASLTVHITGVTTNSDAGTLPNTATVNATNELTSEQNDKSSATITVTTAGHPVGHGDFATIGFWHNKNGQALLLSLNGGSSSTALAKWLATTFPNLFGPNAGTHSLVNSNGSYFTNSQVAAVYLTSAFFGASGTKVWAQIISAAFAAYSTSTTLAGGNVAGKYGFNVSPGGTGSDTVNVGSNGAAFGVPNNSTLTVLQLLQATNSLSSNGNLYNGNATLTGQANTVYDQSVNSAGDIQLFASGSGATANTATLLAQASDLQTGVLQVGLDNLDAGDLGVAEQAAIDDALTNLNAGLTSFGITLVDAGIDPSIPVDISIHFDTTSGIGGVDQGVLGVTSLGGDITLITGWNWYLGSDPTQVGPDQYDFETITTHELGHALGLGHSTDTGSVMYPFLGTGEGRRVLTANDLSTIEQVEDAQPQALMALPPKAFHVTAEQAVALAPPAPAALAAVPALTLPAAVVNALLPATATLTVGPFSFGDTGRALQGMVLNAAPAAVSGTVPAPTAGRLMLDGAAAAFADDGFLLAPSVERLDVLPTPAGPTDTPAPGADTPADVRLMPADGATPVVPQADGSSGWAGQCDAYFAGSLDDHAAPVAVLAETVEPASGLALSALGLAGLAHGTFKAQAERSGRQPRFSWLA